jgi:quinohemoprotein ethanol dehydrogenase
MFTAFRADTGEKLWTAETQAQITGGSASYEIDGVQYVATVAGGQAGFGTGGYYAPNYARLLVYKLDGNAELPKPEPYTQPALNPPPEFGTPAQLAAGEKQYTAHCAGCHGNNAANGRAVSSLFPDLRYSGQLWTTDGFKAVVLSGALQQNGMVSFAKVITPQEADDIRAYMVHQATLAKNAPPPPPGAFGPGGAAPARGGAPAAPGGSTPAAGAAAQPALHQ